MVHPLSYRASVFRLRFFNATPLLNNILSGTFRGNTHATENGTALYEYAVYLYIPFKVTNIKYSFILILNFFITSDSAFVFGTFDVLISIIIFHVWGHLKILKYHLENFPKPAMAGNGQKNNYTNMIYTEEELKEVFEILKENIKHHKLIMEFMNLTSNGFGIMICVSYTYHQIIGCILLLEISSLNMDAFVSYGLLTIIMFQQLIQISVIFELIGSESDTIKHAVYDLPWEYMDVRNKKIVLFFLYNVQEPIALKAMGLVPVGVQTMAAILKTSFSYFIMLRTLADK